MSVVSPLNTVQDDLMFLLGELVKHGDFAQLFFKLGSPDILIRMRARAGYVQTLREKVELRCAQMLERRKLGTSYYNRVIAVRGFANALAELATGLTECIDAGTLKSEFCHPASCQVVKFIKHLNRSIQLIKFGFYTEVRRTSIKVARRADKLTQLFDDVQIHTMKQKAMLDDVELNAAILCNAHLKRVMSVRWRT